MSLTHQERALLAEPLPAADPLPLPELPAAVDAVRALLGDPASAPPREARRRLTAQLTQAAPGSIPGEVLSRLDRIWAAEAALRPVVRAAELPRLAPSGWGARVSLWRGDLTTLAADAVVNAANSGLTGCYQPFHACVDNALHTAAGPRMREDCGRIMASRGRPEPTATATVSRGFALPARLVVHTVGPIVRGRIPGAADAAALVRCYEACGDAAVEAGAESLAFCSISTGVFGYPIAAAAPLVLSAMRAHLEAGRGPAHLIFVTYSETDETVYRTAAEEALHEKAR